MPDLLAACEVTVRGLEHCMRHMDIGKAVEGLIQAREAVAKARGKEVPHEA